MNTTKIAWPDETWNPLRGCSRVSEWTGKVALAPEKTLTAPLRWRKPRRVFVNSMSDLFHESVPDEWIDRIFAVMALCRKHTFQCLSKRPERMREDLLKCSKSARPWKEAARTVGGSLEFEGIPLVRFPLPNVWLGVSAEDQATADERIPLLLSTPAAVHWISAEPLLGPIDFSRCTDMGGGSGIFDGSVSKFARAAGIDRRNSIQWVVAGGESGPGARPCDVSWVRSVVQQCAEAGVPVFVKQLGARPEGWCRNDLDGDDPLNVDRVCDNYEAGEGGHCGSRCVFLADRKVGDPAEWPPDLRVREFPEPRP